MRSHDCHMTITIGCGVVRDSSPMCYLVEDRDNGETHFRRQEEVSHSLGLNTLRINRMSMQGQGVYPVFLEFPSLGSENQTRYTNSPVVRPPIALLPGKLPVTVTLRN